MFIETYLITALMRPMLATEPSDDGQSENKGVILSMASEDVHSYLGSN